MVNTKQGMKGSFTYVGLDIDTTGLRLIDEIVNIAAYRPDAQYSQHIMPLMNLNPGARQRHQIRVINVGCFRMLKSMQTYKIIKTKTEIAALLDFLDWLEKINTKDGIIFVYHDKLKFTPYMVIEAMKKYRLMERFEKIVKSFVNGYDLAGEKPGDIGIKYLTLSQNYKIQLEKLGMEPKDINEFEGDATVRAKLSYDIMVLMAHGGEKKDVSETAMDATVNDFVRQKARAINEELAEIVEQEECIKRQSTLRDIFRGHFQTSRYHRRRAVTFRRLIADAKHDMDTLKQVWEEGKRDAIAEQVKKMDELKEEEQVELIDILDSFFDPEKEVIKPVVQRRENNDGGNNMRQQPRRRRNNQRGRSNSKENQENHPRSPRSNSRRKRSERSDRDQNDRRNSNQHNNNNVMDPKAGAVRKEHRHVDANQNVMVSAN